MKVRYKPIVAKPGKVGGVKATATTTNSITLKWNKVSGASGYRIYQYNTKTKKYVALGSVSSKTTTTGKTSSTTLKKLKSKKTYYVRVRAYKELNGKKVYSAWSSVKKIKVK